MALPVAGESLALATRLHALVRRCELVLAALVLAPAARLPGVVLHLEAKAAAGAPLGLALEDGLTALEPHSSVVLEPMAAHAGVLILENSAANLVLRLATPGSPELVRVEKVLRHGWVAFGEVVYGSVLPLLALWQRSLGFGACGVTVRLVRPWGAWSRKNRRK